MLIEERIGHIEQAREHLAAALHGCDIPQLEAILRSADMELHWALWNVGHTVDLRAESNRPDRLPTTDQT